MENTTAALLNSSTAVDEGNISWTVRVPIIVGFVFLLGNIAAIIFLKCTSKKNGCNTFFRFMGALLVSDLFSCYLMLIFLFVRFTTALCKIIAFSTSFGILSSAFTICFMTFDRYMAITRSLAYYTSEKYKTMAVLVPIWLTAAGVSGLPLIGLGSVKQLHPPGAWCFINIVGSTIGDRIYTFIYAAICNCVLLSTFIMNCAVIVVLCRDSHCAKIGRKSRKKHDIFPIILLIVYVTTFTVCLTPLTVQMLMTASFGGNIALISDANAFTLAMTNAIIDPWIYVLLRKKIILSCLKCCRSGMKRHQNQSPDEPNVVPQRNASRDKNPRFTIKVETHM